MNEWQFWDDGIIGILFILMGIGLLYGAFYIFPNKYQREGADTKTIKKKCRLYKIFAIVLLVSGILTLIGYINF